MVADFAWKNFFFEVEFRYSLENINELTNCIRVTVRAVQPNWQ